MVELIAEIGWNHMGDMKLAEEMIIAAKESGADYAKFQTWKVANLKPGPWDTDGRREIYEKAELSEDDHFHLKEVCDKNDIKFLTSCFTVKDIDFIRLVSNEVKIPGVECRNEELVSQANDKFDRVFLSTGATKTNEIPNLVWHNDKFVVMHCVSIYPCPADKVNMGRMAYFGAQKRGVKIGYSGHFDGPEDAIIAIENGATVVEKHFTTDKNLPGRDNKFALLPEEFKFIKDYFKKTRMDSLREEMSKQGIMKRGPFSEEKEAREVYTGRWDG